MSVAILKKIERNESQNNCPTWPGKGVSVILECFYDLMSLQWFRVNTRTVQMAPFF